MLEKESQQKAQDHQNQKMQGRSSETLQNGWTNSKMLDRKKAELLVEILWLEAQESLPQTTKKETQDLQDSKAEAMLEPKVFPEEVETETSCRPKMHPC